ncbi:putative proline-serine-threonine phosphatase interacting protein [Paragonimus heterotremus]|uniref:Putative proline-serine-threonine phosphatase interacting protein n=1 Tax=Paragonimus heterotremus TaxID=100268 RepID=A0A8J4SHU0_9TREM|nr:putative proline-serine-threonine phosphatase interacting protein [Paragonimus heterotremus]
MMDSCLFAQHFWGDKHVGFDVLYQNLKLACRSTNDFAEFLRESFSVDDAYCKAISKLAKQAGSYNIASTFKPCWSIIRQFIEQIGQLHSTVTQDRQALLKDVQKYIEEQQKRYKSVKEGEVSTQEVVHAFQVTTVQLQKAKELYFCRHTEYQRMLRNESSSTRDQEKLEAKLKKSQDEYKYLIEKYNNLRNQFVGKMQTSCAQFQEIEVSHLDQMREFLHRYSSAWATGRQGLDKLLLQFEEYFAQMSTEQLLQLFVKERGTGSTIPQGIFFEDAEVAAAFSTPNTDRSAAVNGAGMRALEALFGHEPRASSALAAVNTETKHNGQVSQSSLSDTNGDAGSLASASSVVTPTIVTSIPAVSAKRRDGFFRRRRNSLTNDPAVSGSASVTQTGSAVAVGLGPSSDTSGPTLLSTGSLSAFNIVAKRGIRRFGTPLSNGKGKFGSKRDLKSEGSTGEDWHTASPVELPKDEEGFSIPPTDPWTDTVGYEPSGRDQSSSDSGSDVDVVGRSFKGLKASCFLRIYVKIRPVGDFAPSVSTLLSPKPTVPKSPSTRSHVPVLCDRRVSKSARSDHASTIGHSNLSLLASGSDSHTSGTKLIHRLPTAPALPPPPAPVPFSTSGTVSQIARTEDGLPLQRLRDIASCATEPGTVRPRLLGSQTWGKTLSLDPSRTQRSFQTSFDPVFSDSTKLALENIGSTDSSSGLEFTESVTTAEQTTRSPSTRGKQSTIDSYPMDLRRCSSAIPESMRLEPGSHTMNKAGWVRTSTTFCAYPKWPNLAFDSDFTNSSWNSCEPTNTPNAWATGPSDSVSLVIEDKNTLERITPTQPEPTVCVGSKFSRDSESVTSIPSLGSFAFPTASTAGTIVTPPRTLLPAKPIPIAAAFTETWRVRFHNGGGSSFSTAASIIPPPLQAVSGTLTLAFPTLAVEQLVREPTVGPLILRLNNAIRFKNIQLKLEGSLISGCSEDNTFTCEASTFPSADYVITIPGAALVQHFTNILSTISRPASDSSGANSSNYVKLDVLSYAVELNAIKKLHALTPPIHLCTYWRCERGATDFRLDYTSHWPSNDQAASCFYLMPYSVTLDCDWDWCRFCPESGFLYSNCASSKP